MINLSHSKLLSLIEPYKASERWESASFLMWYFANYLRLDELDAIDAVCDASGDKGIDGIYLNDEMGIIEVYQSKLFEKRNPIVGDRALREFDGTLLQLKDETAIEHLLSTSGNAQVANLVRRLELKKHIAEYDVVGYFVCNGNLDKNGRDFLKGVDGRINFIGRNDLEETYISSERDMPNLSPAVFDVSEYDTSKYTVDAKYHAIIAPIKASELVEIDGIADQQIFASNVRGPLGKTRVNRDIVKSISDKSRHNQFPLFHNGITIIAESVVKSGDSITIEKYRVVNGCQSLNALYTHRDKITDNLKILTKFIQTSADPKLSEIITQISNNQNGVRPRDFKSNDQVQIRLQNEFKSFYSERFFFEIKRGEESADIQVITNELAGQCLMSFDLKEPWSTHRKYQIFEEKYTKIFSGPSVTAHRIIFCYVILTRIEEQKQSIENELVAKYVLTKFLILYIVRLILENEKIAKNVISDPEKYVSNKRLTDVFSSTIDEILREIILEFNFELEEQGLDENFDYRGRLRDEHWCSSMARKIAASYKKNIARKRVETFDQLYAKKLEEMDPC